MAKVRRIKEGDGFAPAAGPYSYASVAGDTVYVGGQIGLAADGTLVTGGIEAEVRQTMENLGKILRAAGADFKDVVKATICLTDVADFAAMNKVYGNFFPEGEYPARETVGIAALPFGAKVEISLVATISE